MSQIIGNQQQFKIWMERKGKKVPVQVSELIRQRVEILDSYYGESRDMERDMGGFCVVLNSREGRETLRILKKYRIDLENYEYSDVIFNDGNEMWIENLYLLNNDYGIILFQEIQGGKRNA